MKQRLRVFITGGSGSLGTVLVEQFSANGYDVHFQFDTNAKLANELSKRCSATGYCATGTSVASISALATSDVLVNATAINTSSDLTHETTLQAWQHTIDVNLTLPFLSAKAVIPHMIDRGWGRIIQVGSIFSTRGVARNAPYTSSKHGASGLTKTIAKEYGIHGITANEILPGPFDSQLLNRIAEFKAKALGIDKDDYFAKLSANVPTGRLISMNSIAAACLFLASEGAQDINGSSITVDGGQIS